MKRAKYLYVANLKQSFLVFIVILLSFGAIFAQAPQAFKYQAIARDSIGNLMPNENIDIQISIITDNIDGTVQYQETHSLTTTQYGSFAIEIGNGTVQSGTFSNITWGSGDKFIKVEAKKDGESTYKELVTSQLLSVPYALHAGNVKWSENGSDIGYTNGNVGIGRTDPAEMLELYKSGGDAVIRFHHPGIAEYKIGMGSGEDIFRIVNTNGSNAITSNNNGLILNSSGDIGIGTTNPTEKFEVTGAIKVSGPNANNYQYNAGFFDYYPSEGAVRFCTGSSDDQEHDMQFLVMSTDMYYIPMILKGNTGNIGIGTTNPLRKLHIANNNDNGDNSIIYNPGDDRPGLVIRGGYPELALISNQYDNGTHGASLRLAAYDDGNLNTWKHWVIGTAGGDATFLDFGYAENEGNHHAGIRNHAGNTFMTILNNGNVGIGTTNPGATLDINGGIRISQGNQSFNFSGGLFMTGTGNVLNLQVSTSSSTSDAEVFGVYNNNSENIASFRNDGNVGIGTIDPQTKLHNTGSSQFDDNIHGGDNNELHFISTRPSQSNSSQIRFTTSDGSGQSERMRIAPGGNIGINTSNPQGRLHVNGEVIVGGGGVEVGGCLIYDNSTTPGSMKYYDEVTDSFYVLNESGVTYSGTLWNQSGSDLYYNAGNIGIGRSNPISALHIEGSDHTYLTLQSAAGTQAGIEFYDGYGSNQWDIMSVNDREAPNNSLNFDASSSLRVLTLLQSGNVGIGVANPSEKLAVGGNIQANGKLDLDFPNAEENAITLENGTLIGWTPGSGNDPGYIQHYEYADDEAYMRISLSDNPSAVNDKLQIGATTNGPSSFESKAEIDAAGNAQFDGNLSVDGSGNSYFVGNLGIGTSSPSATLDVSGGINISAGNQTFNFNSGLDMVGTGGGYNLRARTTSSTSTAEVFGVYNNSDENIASFRNDGFVTIGANSPNTTLTVYGYTQLGGNGTDVPKIKTKIITGTLNGNASETITTGILEATFIDFEMTVDYSGYGYRKSGYNGDGPEGFFEIKTYGNNIIVSSKGSGIVNRPYKLFIIYYEE